MFLQDGGDGLSYFTRAMASNVLSEGSVNMDHRELFVNVRQEAKLCVQAQGGSQRRKR